MARRAALSRVLPLPNRPFSASRIGARERSLDQTSAQRLGHGVGPVVDLQLLEDRLQPLLDGDFAPIHGQPDLAIGRTLARLGEDLQVLLTEVGIADRLLASQPAELLEHTVEQLGAELSAASGG